MRLKNSRLTTAETKRLIEYFVAGTTARTAGELVGVNKNTAVLFYHKLRCLIFLKMQEKLTDDWILTEKKYYLNYFEQKLKQKKNNKSPLFVLVPRDQYIQTFLVTENSTFDLNFDFYKSSKFIIPDSIVYDVFQEKKVINVNTLYLHRLTKPFTYENDKRANINGIENFWKQSKNHLTRFNGIHKKHFYLFLKEVEWRYNYGKPTNLLKTLSSWIKN